MNGIEPSDHPRLTVTVVIVCFNHSRFVEQALDAAFGQTHQPTRVVIMDDASSDESVDRIRAYLSRTGAEALFVAHEENVGLCRTLNEALTYVDTDCVALIAADDWMESNRLERQLGLMESLPDDVAVVHSDMFLVNEAGERLPGTYQQERRPATNPLGHGREGDVFADLVKRSEISTPAALIRTSVFDAIGTYDESLDVEDYDMWLRIAQRFTFAYLPEPLVNYRILDTSMYRSLGTFRHQLMQLTVLRKHIDARPDLGPVVARRLEQLAVALYLGGRRPEDTASDLRLVLGRAPSARARCYLGLATFKVPGDWVRLVNERRLALRPKALE